MAGLEGGQVVTSRRDEKPTGVGSGGFMDVAH